MKNTLTIAITKYYSFKSSAETMDVAFDEYLNTLPTTRKYLHHEVVEPVEFITKTKINKPKEKKK